ncbi:MAG TPA: hypothetical protein VHQ64_12290 [Pyrinomonadaceae bacterium]|jgi:hypothetical protein|nr:hypothetical protein [Pyrinomonadaceae bacterium]
MRVFTSMVLVLFGQLALVAQKIEPRFEKYSADVYAGEPAPLICAAIVWRSRVGPPSWTM